MYLYIYVCVYIYVYVCVCVYMCVYVCIYIILQKYILSFLLFLFFCIFVSFAEYGLLFWSEFRIYRRAHNIFRRFELVLFLPKFIAVNFEIVKELAMGFSQALWSLRCRGVFRTQSGV